MLPAAIRQARPDDVPAVERLVHDAYHHYVERIGKPPGPMLDDYAAQVAAGRVWLMEQDGQLAGLVVLIAQDGAMLLDNVAVAPAMQGRGLGRELVAFAEQATLDAGLSVLELYTHEMMTENVALYTRLGFAETHRGVEKGFHRVYMRKTLPGG